MLRILAIVAIGLTLSGCATLIGLPTGGGTGAPMDLEDEEEQETMAPSSTDSEDDAGAPPKRQRVYRGGGGPRMSDRPTSLENPPPYDMRSTGGKPLNPPRQTLGPRDPLGLGNPSNPLKVR